MDDQKSNIDEQVLANLSEALSRITDLVAKTLREDRYYPGFREDMLDIRRRVDKVVHVLHEGNGEKPLVTRMALAEAEIDNLKEKIQEISHKPVDSATVTSSKITMQGYIIVGIISSVTAIIVGLIQKIL